MKVLNSYERVQKMNSMQAITIRQVRPEDLDAVTEVEAVCFPKAEAADRASFEARIKAILRRNSMRNRKSEEPKKQVIVAGSLKLDRDGRRVFVNEKEINLTAKEFDLLELLVCNPNKVYSREALLAYVWGNKAMDSGDVRTVDVHVRRLREKIEPSPSAPQFVHTKWGVGYYFAAK